MRLLAEDRHEFAEGLHCGVFCGEGVADDRGVNYRLCAACYLSYGGRASHRVIADSDAKLYLGRPGELHLAGDEVEEGALDKAVYGLEVCEEGVPGGVPSEDAGVSYDDDAVAGAREGDV